MKRLVLALIALLPVFASAQVYNKFGPATGVLKGSTATYQTTAAASSDIRSLWSGTCDATTFLRGDGACVAASISTPVSATNGGTGEAGTITGIPKANASSAFTAAVSSDVYSLWSGTCNSTTFLRGDGACAAAGGGSAAGSNTQVQYNASGSFGASGDFTWDNSLKVLTLSETLNQITPALNIVGGSNISHAIIQITDQTGGVSYAMGGIGGVFVIGDYDPGTSTITRAFDFTDSGPTITSSNLKANGSHVLGINSSGQINLNGSTGTATYVITANGGSPATWSPVNYAAQSASLGGSVLVAGACSSTTTSVPNASAGMGVVATPNTYPGDGNYWYGYASSFGNITVKVCSVLGGTPTASTYEIRVFP